MRERYNSEQPRRCCFNLLVEIRKECKLTHVGRANP
jgi:hypothetical protein